jgi:hypothetical protein
LVFPELVYAGQERAMSSSPILWMVVALGITAISCADGAGAFGGRYTEREEKRFEVTGRPELTLSTFDGTIEIRGWDRPEVLAIVEKQGLGKDAVGGIEVRATQDGGRIAIDVRRSPAARMLGFSWGSGRVARLIVSAPAASDIRAMSGDGAIVVDGIDGAVELRSGDGNISGEHTTGVFKARTGDGSIVLAGVDGLVEADTGDGSVALDGALTRVRVRTGDGSVRVRAAKGSAAREDWEITTGDGSVTVELPDGFDADLDARTGDGHIDTTDISVSNVIAGSARSNFRGRLGAGGNVVRVRTGDGGIVLRRSH